jgi:superfamily II DNA/RNA helicase
MGVERDRNSNEGGGYKRVMEKNFEEDEEGVDDDAVERNSLVATNQLKIDVIEKRRQVVRNVIRERIGTIFEKNGWSASCESDEAKSNNKGNVKDNELVVLPVSIARGLHIANVEHIFVLQPPNSMDEYLHMSGRTCRAGNRNDSGHVTTVVTLEEMKRMTSWQTALGIHFQIMTS